MYKTLPLANLGDTIVAAATGPAGGAVSLIRLSGPQAASVAGRILAPKSGQAFPPEPRKAVLMRVMDGDTLLDRAVVIYFRAPASYTGDDVFEIACHGSPYITARVLASAIANGARAAERGEFSMRAFLNGKMDLAQAEGLCDLIIAKTSAAHKAALSMTEGKVSDGFALIKQKAVVLLAEAEARIDDADDEIPPLDCAYAEALLTSARTELKKLAATFELGRFMKDGIAVAIAGAPNAGKSSLLNALAGYERAIVAPTPGTTRDTIEQSVDLDGFRLILTDTAGIRDHALDPAEQEGIRAPFDTDAEVVRISCKTGAGLDKLRTALLKKLPVDDMDENSAIVTSARHYNALLNAGAELEKASEFLLADKPPFELAAVHLNGALRELEGAVGVTAADEILGAVFSRFCVGK